MAFILPILAGAFGFLGGKSSGGGDILSDFELFTSKRTDIDLDVDARQNTFAPQLSLTFDKTTSVASGGSTIVTEKTFTPSQSVSPSQVIPITIPTIQGAGADIGAGANQKGGGIDLFSIAIIGGLGFLGYTYFKKKKK